MYEITSIYDTYGYDWKAKRLYRVLRFEYNDGIVFGVVFFIDPDEIQPLHDYTYFYFYLN